MSWNNSGLSVGKVYTAIANITNASGANFKTPSSFRINYNSLSRAEFTYYASGDDLKVTSWLEIDSKIIASVSQINIEIRDGSLTLIKTLSSSAPTAEGYFNTNWDGTTAVPTGLEEGVVYTCSVKITTNGGMLFTSPASFSITVPKRLQVVEDVAKATQAAVTEKLNEQIDVMTGTGMTAAEVIAQGGMTGIIQSKMTEQSNTITNKTTEMKNTIDTKMTEQTNIITTKTTEMKTAVETTLASFETRSDAAITKLQSGADQAVEAGQQVAGAASELEATAKKYSWNSTVSPNPALAGDDITLQVQGQPGLMPMVTIYSWDNKILMGDRYFKETADGLYAFAFKADERFTPGKSFTYVVSESITGGLIAGSGTVESMSITTIAGLAAAAPEAEKAAKKALDAISAIEAMLISRDNTNIALTLRSLQASVERIPSIFAKEAESSKVTADTLNEISERLKKMAGEEGYDLSSILEQKLADSPTMKDVRTKTDRIQTTTGILLKLFEAEFGGEDAIVVSVGLEHGSVIFRIIAANPSKTKPQTVNIKQYLPQEVKPSDIMEIISNNTSRRKLSPAILWR